MTHHVLLNFDNVGKLTIAHTLRTFSLGMISVFLPIFLYSKGYTIFEIVIFEALFFLTSVFINPFFLKFNSKLGIKIGIILSFFFTIMFYLSLYSNEALISYGKYIFLLVIFFFSKVGDQLYWMAFHLDFATKFNKKNEGSQLGIINAVPIALSILAPFLGGFLITGFSYGIVFAFVIAILFIAIFPIFYSENIKLKNKIDYVKILNFKDMRLNLIYVIEGANHIALGFIWPLFLFFLNITLASIGAIYSFTSLLNAASNYYSAKISDGKNRSKIFKKGSVFFGFTIVARPLFESLPVLVSFQSIGGMSAPFFLMPFMNFYFRKAKKDPINVISNRETYLNLGRFISFLVVFLLLLYLPLKTALVSFIIFGGVLTALCYFLAKAIENDY